MSSNGNGNGNGNSRHGFETAANGSRETRTTGLDVVIIGAGIGGLTTALFLRQQGHRVTVLEQSRFANETGAAIHLAPNSNGLLRRLGIYAEKLGANLMESITEYDTRNNLIRHVELTESNKQWQHPWHLVRRVHLHEELKRRAVSPDEDGAPVTLRLQSRVTQIDTASSTATLESGECVRGDVLIGADGVHSRSRAAVSGNHIKPKSSSKSAFRFLVSRQRALEDPKTAQFAQRDGELIIWFGVDRRVVMYPCENNRQLNFVCIHPSTESESKGDSDEWNLNANKDRMLAVYAGFDESLLALLDKADAESLKVWELLDMDTLSSWVRGRLALMGDAAHPFLPHQGQGAACAIEDAAALGVVLQSGVKSEEVPERLQLYESIRQQRANKIQEYSRVAGRDLGEKQLDMMEFAGYNMGHDEWDNAINAFRRWDWARKPHLSWGMPVSFGPIPNPHEAFKSVTRRADDATFITTSIKFKTSRTLLQNLFPSASFRFKSAATVAYASFSQTTFNKPDWRSGSGRRHMGLYIHGVQYVRKSGETLDGSYLPVLFESSVSTSTDTEAEAEAEAAANRRKAPPMPRLQCSLDVWRREKSIRIQTGWQGAIFGNFVLEGLREVSPSEEICAVVDEDDQGVFAYGYMPPSDLNNHENSNKKEEEAGRAIEYAMLFPRAEEPKSQTKATATTTKTPWGQTRRVYEAKEASISFDPLDWEALPTLHHVVSRLAEIPIYEVISGQVVEGVGMPDISTARRID